MSDKSQYCDEVCSERGVPEHLHAGNREPVHSFSPSELLYRRVKLEDVKTDPTAAISFSRMSVNRSSFCRAPEDVLINDEEGGFYSGYSIFALPVEALATSWEHEAKDISFISLNPEHIPKRCNYSHSEIVLSKTLESGEEIEVSKFKPKSLKLKMRDHLRPYFRET
ncbi:MAG: hypothetical protein AAF357_07345 [Verrucomicrobiota bacterium]